MKCYNQTCYKEETGIYALGLEPAKFCSEKCLFEWLDKMNESQKVHTKKWLELRKNRSRRVEAV